MGKLIIDHNTQQYSRCWPIFPHGKFNTNSKEQFIGFSSFLWNYLEVCVIPWHGLHHIQTKKSRRIWSFCWTIKYLVQISTIGRYESCNWIWKRIACDWREITSRSWIVRRIEKVRGVIWCKRNCSEWLWRMGLKGWAHEYDQIKGWCISLEEKSSNRLHDRYNPDPALKHHHYLYSSMESSSC